MRFSDFVESIVQDTRYAARGLLRRPAFTIVAVATLAIGVGGTTAIFSAVDALLLRPLPYSRPDELMKLTLVTPKRGDRPGTDDMVWSYPKFTVFRDAQHAFSELSLYEALGVTLTNGDAELVTVEAVGATYFRTLGLTLSRGRDFDRSIDAHAGAPHEVILSQQLWNGRYNADPDIVGKTIDIDRDPYTVIGVAPRDFTGLTGRAQLFVPVTTRDPRDLAEPQSHEFYLVGRRAPGVTVDQAESATRALGLRVSETFRNPIDKAQWSAKAAPLDDARLAPSIERSLFILFGAVGMVLLIACVNVANLLIGRASARQREIAVRVAIGAGRGRLMRLLLTESLLLSFVGAVASLAVAWIGVRALGSIDPATTLRTARDGGLGAVAFSSISLDWTALAFAFGVSLAVGLLFGLAPAIGTTRASLTSALKGGERSASGSRAFAGRRALVVTEIALALVLLAGSGLMLRSLAKLLGENFGFDGSNVLTLRLNIPPGAVARDSMPGFYATIVDGVRAVPGVTNVALNNCPPLTGGCNGTSIQFLDRPLVDLAHAPTIGVHWATPEWFSTLRVPLLRGRLFSITDRMGAPQVTVINEVAAKQFWPNDDPIGKRVKIGQGGFDDATVIGIVGAVRQKADSEPRPEVYVAYDQSPRSGMTVFIRSARPAASLLVDVRRAIREVAPELPAYDTRTMAERMAAATAQQRFRTVLLALFALTALVLAVVGIYGVMSLMVTARWRELGIRAALGADRARVLRLVVGEGAALVAIGAILGLAGAFGATRLLAAFLFDVSPTDPTTYVSIIVVLAGAALAASWIPARRAAGVDPVEALRAD